MKAQKIIFGIFDPELKITIMTLGMPQSMELDNAEIIATVLNNAIGDKLPGGCCITYDFFNK